MDAHGRKWRGHRIPVRPVPFYLAAMPTMSTFRFLRQYLRPAPGRVVVEQTSYRRGGEVVPATLFRPARAANRRLPGWLVLHGLTYTGREHPALIRFATAVASTGRTVFVPDIPEWRALRVAPAATIPTIQAAVHALHDRDDVDPDRVGILGFSFGATQALVAAADPAIDPLLRGIVAWGGYHELPSLFRFGLTGEYGADGARYHLEPDPYGCWVMSGNYLTAVRGHEHEQDVADALMALATESGRRGSYAWEPVYDEAKLRLRAGLPPERRTTFDMLAPLTTQPRVITEAHLELAAGLAEAAARVDPLLVPAPFLPGITTPIALAHGRDDRLVPFTESVTMARALPPETLRSLTVTALFAHSGGRTGGLGLAGSVREGVQFLTLLDRVLGLID
jgi:acetyl esterase/lipase